MKTILVFRTSVTRKKEINRLRPILNTLLPYEQWNFDLEDCDKILRVETLDLTAPVISSALEVQGFSCEEL
ncbi:MAG: hypothetical protein V7724_16765 [Sediminicola sp.]|tara:strand:- start:50811 stop:51023 length:213 start_codon:yes stop_codon:yes gene_type:complete